MERIRLSLPPQANPDGHGPSGEHSVEISRHGATVLSWKADGQERLYLSPLAKLDGSKAIRGGIPLVFPVFGKVDWMPTQHGFARDVTWEYVGQRSSSQAVSTTLSGAPLTPALDAAQPWVQAHFRLNAAADPRIQAHYPHAFVLDYYVTLFFGKIRLALCVHNTSSEEIAFDALLHTYLAIPAKEIMVQGLQGTTYADKVSGAAVRVDQDAAICIEGEVDRTYQDAPDAIQILKKGSKEVLFTFNKTHFKDYVVWNPWIEKSKNMVDFPDDGYESMLCIEAGSVHEAPKSVTLAGGQSWQAWQDIAVPDSISANL